VNPSQCTMNRMVAARVVPAADRGRARTMAELPSGWHGQSSYKTACVKKGRRAHQWSLLSPGNSPLIYRRSPVISRVNVIIHEHGATRSDLLLFPCQ